jgi:hypothetical protein
MKTIVAWIRRVADDLINLRNVDAYVVAFIGVILVALGVVNPPDDQLYLVVLTAGLAVLLFRETAPEKKEIDLDGVLLDRQNYKPLREFLQRADVVWACGPSNYNILRDPSLKREVLDHGGEVRVLLQDPNEAASMAILRQQLDTTSDLDHDIRGSLLLLEKMAQSGNAEYRLLPYNPGFSMLIVNPHSGNGYLTVEFFGYHNKLIDERMHILIERRSSARWFDYWVSQYKIMWDASKEPT